MARDPSATWEVNIQQLLYRMIHNIEKAVNYGFT